MARNKLLMTSTWCVSLDLHTTWLCVGDRLWHSEETVKNLELHLSVWLLLLLLDLFTIYSMCCQLPPQWPSRKVSVSRAEHTGIEPQVKTVTWNWSSGSYPARHLSLQGQFLDWLAQCHYPLSGWDGKFNPQLLTQWGSTDSCLCRSTPKTH